MQLVQIQGRDVKADKGLTHMVCQERLEELSQNLTVHNPEQLDLTGGPLRQEMGPVCFPLMRVCE